MFNFIVLFPEFCNPFLNPIIKCVMRNKALVITKVLVKLKGEESCMLILKNIG